MRAILEIILMLLDLYWWIVLAMIIMSWLFSFNVINGGNEFVANVWRVLNSLTEPVLKPIRRFLPNLGGLDLSPIALFILIYFIKRVIILYIYPNVF